jgi:hypothetical protein
MSSLGIGNMLWIAIGPECATYAIFLSPVGMIGWSILQSTFREGRIDLQVLIMITEVMIAIRMTTMTMTAAPLEKDLEVMIEVEVRWMDANPSNRLSPRRYPIPFLPPIPIPGSILFPVLTVSTMGAVGRGRDQTGQLARKRRRTYNPIFVITIGYIGWALIYLRKGVHCRDCVTKIASSCSTGTWKK